MRNFYSCSVGEKDKGYDEDNLKRIRDKQAFILHEATPQKGNYSSIKKDDILVLKYRGSFIAYGEALDIKKTADKDWNLFAPVKEWIFFDNSNPEKGIGIYGMQDATLGGSQYGTVKPLEGAFSLKKIREINHESTLFKTIEREFFRKKERIKMQEKVQLLKYKKQIILQGPPGTGKTRLAKLMAEEMTKSNAALSALDKIDDFFKSTDTKNPIFLQKRKSQYELIENFQKRFPKEKLVDITKENYALGTGKNDSFCWWIERGLKPLGYYSPGSARSYMLYWKKEISNYSKHGFVKSTPDFDEAMKKIVVELDKAVNQNNHIDILRYFGEGFVLKVLNSYYPDTFFPINSVKCIENALKIFDFDYSGLNQFEKNFKLQEIYVDKCKQFNTDITNFEFMHFLFVEFNLKEPLVLDAQSLIKKGKFKIIQFHPSFTYEDFVRGITAKTNADDKVYYKVEDRILMEFAQEALENRNNNYILILDEINRANLSSVLGELIYGLEYRYYFDKENHQEASVESLYDISNGDDEPNRTLILPENLYIIGTMNTADRSVGHIDYAIRRRFAFVNVLPDAAVIDNPNAKVLFEVISNLFESKDTLASDFKPEQVQLGHSYFIVKDDAELTIRAKYEIIPILEEYLKDGILLEKAEDLILDLKASFGK
jgi:5-methylcytosine-specific restriction enzyme B